ncbi:MAG: hypothetical protein JW841_18325 [Deltaproteobacteria bacterium]|nr:hypothetical protein [Deltaproteobacteria bacterium]
MSLWTLPLLAIVLTQPIADENFRSPSNETKNDIRSNNIDCSKKAKDETVKIASNSYLWQREIILPDTIKNIIEIELTPVDIYRAGDDLANIRIIADESIHIPFAIEYNKSKQWHYFEISPRPSTSRTHTFNRLRIYDSRLHDSQIDFLLNEIELEFSEPSLSLDFMITTPLPKYHGDKLLRIGKIEYKSNDNHSVHIDFPKTLASKLLIDLRHHVKLINPQRAKARLLQPKLFFKYDNRCKNYQLVFDTSNSIPICKPLDSTIIIESTPQKITQALLGSAKRNTKYNSQTQTTDDYAAILLVLKITLIFAFMALGFMLFRLWRRVEIINKRRKLK